MAPFKFIISYYLNLNKKCENLETMDAKYGYAAGSFIDESKAFPEENKKTSCISGRENINTEPKLKQQFRYNRVRVVPNDQPAQGHLPVSFSNFSYVTGLAKKTFHH